MYGNLTRDENYITKLKAFLKDNYSILPQEISPAPRGFFGETWVVVTDEKRYFLKLDYSLTHKDIYAKSFSTIKHITSNNIDFIPKIIESGKGALYLNFDFAVLGLFEWVDGTNIENDETKIHEYEMLADIYALPCENLSARVENFSCDCINLFESLKSRLKNTEDKNAVEILRVIKEKEDILSHRFERLQLFANRSKEAKPPLHITHGDPGGNLLVSGNNYTLIDWDDPVIAPVERDAWFACMRFDWAREHFNKCLLENNISYKIDRDIMAYYCYYSFIYFLCEYLRVYFELPHMRDVLPGEIEGYFNCWIEINVKIADNYD